MYLMLSDPPSKPKIFFKFGPFDVKTCLLLAPVRRLIRPGRGRFIFGEKKAFLDSKLVKMPCFFTKPEQKDTK
jgi:hypothetical protein